MLVPLAARPSIPLVKSGNGGDGAVGKETVRLRNHILRETSRDLVTHRWQLWKDDEQRGEKVERKQDRFVFCIMRRDEEEDDGYRGEPFLGRGILSA